MKARWHRAVGFALTLSAVPGLALADPALSGTLSPDRCHARPFVGGGTFNSAVTHTHNFNDVYQIVCEPGGEVCWSWSFNIGNGGTMLTAGLSDSDWEWWICAWDTNRGKTKYQAIVDLGTASDRAGARLGEMRVVDLSAASVPAGVRQVLELARR